MNNILNKVYDFNYPKMKPADLHQHMVDKYQAMAWNDPHKAVKMSLDDVLLLLRHQRRTGLSTEEVRVLMDMLMVKYRKAKIAIDLRSVSSHLSRAYNLGLIDREPVEGQNDERYIFPRGMRLDGTDAKADRIDRWNLGITRKKERANASVRGGNERLAQLGEEEDEFQRTLASTLV